MASNRGVIWLGWTACLAALGLYGMLRCWGAEKNWQPRLLSQRLPLLLGLVVPVWATVQALPLGQFLPLPAGWGPTISVLPQVAPGGILRMMGYLILASLILAVAARRDRALRLGWLIFAGVVAQGLYALVALNLLGDVAPWGEKSAYPGAATGSFVNRNALATFLGLGLVLGAGLLAEGAAAKGGRGTRQAPWFLPTGPGGVCILIGMAALLAALVATQSRLGLFASLLGLATTVMVLGWRSARAGAALLAAAGAFALALLVLGHGGMLDRLLFTVADGGNRLALYGQTLAMIAERPFAGHGMDAFGPAFEAVRAPPLIAPVTYDLAHNSYLMLWAEFGLIAGSAPLVALGLVALRLFRRLHLAPAHPGLAAAGLGALMLGGVHALGDFSLEIPAVTYLFVAILSLGLAWPGRAVQPSAPFAKGG